LAEKCIDTKKSSKHGIPLVNKSEKKTMTIALIVIIIFFILATILTKFNPFQIFFDMHYFWDFIFKDLTPPDFSRAIGLWDGILMTIAMAFAATFIGGLLAFSVSFLGSYTTSPSGVLVKIVRGIASFERNIPSLIWVFILVMAYGIGTTVGFMALVLETFGFLVRAFIETIDEVGGESIEAMDAVGANFFKKLSQCVIPASLPGFISWILYSIEVNIRAATIVGTVGGGGIGLILLGYLKAFRYHTASGVILAVAGTVIIVDIITNLIRKMVLV